MENSISNLVKDKYKMAKNCGVGKYHFKGVLIDTATVDLETLDQAVAKGFDIVEAIKQKKEDPTKK